MFLVLNEKIRSNVGSTFWGDVCVEMESWCARHCQGDYSVLAIDQARFEQAEDRDRYIGKWGGAAVANMDMASL